jgi:hypothetical protein
MTPSAQQTPRRREAGDMTVVPNRAALGAEIAGVDLAHLDEPQFARLLQYPAFDVLARLREAAATQRRFPLVLIDATLPGLEGIGVVETEYGRIALLICADTFIDAHFERLKQLHPDLLGTTRARAAPGRSNRCCGGATIN